MRVDVNSNKIVKKGARGFTAEHFIHLRWQHDLQKKSKQLIVVQNSVALHRNFCFRYLGHIFAFRRVYGATGPANIFFFIHRDVLQRGLRRLPALKAAIGGRASPVPQGEITLGAPPPR